MKRWSVLLVFLACSSLGSNALAADADGDIRDLLANQVDAWNRGNLESFVSYYAEDCTFMGPQILHSRDKVLARYRKSYSSRAAMGKLTFSDLDVRQLTEHIALATANWRLIRTAETGGDIGGYFSLILKDVDDEWRIVLDHTTASPGR